MRTEEDVRKHFNQDIKDHKMHVLLDNGVYRHLNFSKDGTRSYSFDIVTYPGFLVISGDMGCYVFSRLHDMFDFFTTHIGRDGNEYIDFRYWAEKLQADIKHTEFSIERLKKSVEDYIDRNLDGEGWTKKQIKDLKVDVAYECFSDENDVRCFDALTNYEYTDSDNHLEFQFSDVWDWFGHSSQEYTFHYVWCCFAIVHALKDYKNSLTKITEEVTI